MRRNIFAYTAPMPYYPEYVSINKEDDGQISISVRNRSIDDREGTMASVTLPIEESNRLMEAFNGSNSGR